MNRFHDNCRILTTFKDLNLQTWYCKLRGAIDEGTSSSWKTCCTYLGIIIRHKPYFFHACRLNHVPFYSIGWSLMWLNTPNMCSAWQWWHRGIPKELCQHSIRCMDLLWISHYTRTCWLDPHIWFTSIGQSRRLFDICQQQEHWRFINYLPG